MEYNKKTRELLSEVGRNIRLAEKFYDDFMEGRIGPMTLHGLPEDPEEREHAACAFSVLLVLSMHRDSAIVGVDATAFQIVVSMLAVHMSVRKMYELGILQGIIDYDDTDEFGWPLVRITEKPNMELAKRLWGDQL